MTQLHEVKWFVPPDAERFRFSIGDSQRRELERIADALGAGEQDLASIARLAREDGRALDVLRAWTLYRDFGMTDQAEELRVGCFGPEREEPCQLCNTSVPLGQRMTIRHEGGRESHPIGALCAQCAATSLERLVRGAGLGPAIGWDLDSRRFVGVQ